MDGSGSGSRKQSESSVNAERPAEITVAWRHDKFACQGRMGTNSKDLFPFVFLYPTLKVGVTLRVG